jgi:hypothetical protein
VGPSGDSASLARLCIMGEFFISWFIHAIGVSVFSVFAAAAIMGRLSYFIRRILRLEIPVRKNNVS